MLRPPEISVKMDATTFALRLLNWKSTTDNERRRVLFDLVDLLSSEHFIPQRLGLWMQVIKQTTHCDKLSIKA